MNVLLKAMQIKTKTKQKQYNYNNNKNKTSVIIKNKMDASPKPISFNLSCKKKTFFYLFCRKNHIVGTFIPTNVYNEEVGSNWDN